MFRSFQAGIAAVLTVAVAAVSGPVAFAQQKHDSNTLHKLGNAIQYPVRKATENASITAHRATGRKSVVHRRNGNRTYRAVVTTSGHVHRLYPLHRTRRHARHHRRHR